ncbi:hypothetical protein ml_60 [Mollivirus sibericum]|uniref:hypothetical protein n=1 Tax=Mollivirus sibericum TaxID=1678078 RepID=UPI0006B2ECB3|nr:hypothetical protein ml_60 [Mollivirus sibericum]ALD61862.1 hypothetical protein ml_60 [Mollivirus sibericum]
MEPCRIPTPKRSCSFGRSTSRLGLGRSPRTPIDLPRAKDDAHQSQKQQEQDSEVARIMAALTEAMRPVVEDMVSRRTEKRDVANRQVSTYHEGDGPAMRTFILGVPTDTSSRLYEHILESHMYLGHVVVFTDNLKRHGPESFCGDHIPKKNLYTLDMNRLKEILGALNSLEALESHGERSLIIIDANILNEDVLADVLDNCKSSNVDFCIAVDRLTRNGIEQRTRILPYVDRLITTASNFFDLEPGKVVPYVLNQGDPSDFAGFGRREAMQNCAQLLIAHRSSPGNKFEHARYNLPAHF